MKIFVFLCLVAVAASQNLTAEQQELLAKIQAHFEKTVNGLPTWMQQSAKELIEKHYGKRNAVVDIEEMASKMAVDTAKPVVDAIKQLVNNNIDFNDFAKMTEVVSDLKDVFMHILQKHSQTKRDTSTTKTGTNDFWIRHLINTPLHVGNIFNKLTQTGGKGNTATIENILKGDLVGKITNIVNTGKRQLTIKTTVNGKTHTITHPTGVVNINDIKNFGDIELLKALGIDVGKRAVTINITNDIGGKIAGQIQHLVANSCLKNLWRNVNINITNQIAGDFLGVIRNIINIKC